MRIGGGAGRAAARGGRDAGALDPFVRASVARIWAFEATREEELAEVGGAIHDAYFDPDEVTHDEESATLSVPFQQEIGQFSDIASYELAESTWTSRIYRVPYVRGTLTVHHVIEFETSEGWGDAGSLDDVTLEPGRTLHIHEVSGELRAQVRELRVDVAVDDEVVRHHRRRVGRLLGTESDRPWPS